MSRWTVFWRNWGILVTSIVRVVLDGVFNSSSKCFMELGAPDFGYCFFYIRYLLYFLFFWITWVPPLVHLNVSHTFMGCVHLSSVLVFFLRFQHINFHFPVQFSWFFFLFISTFWQIDEYTFSDSAHFMWRICAWVFSYNSIFW